MTESEMRDALGERYPDLAPYARRMVRVVDAAGGAVVELGVEMGAPEVRFSLPAGTPDDVARGVRRAINAIQQEVP